MKSESFEDNCLRLPRWAAVARSTPRHSSVAATALERGSEVATFKRRHFAQVKGLKVVEPE